MMTSPIIYETFDQWFHSKSAYNKKAESFDGEHEWLRAAFEAGRAGAIEQAANIAEDWMPGSYAAMADLIVQKQSKRIAAKIRKLGEDK